VRESGDGQRRRVAAAEAAFDGVEGSSQRRRGTEEPGNRKRPGTELSIGQAEHPEDPSGVREPVLGLSTNTVDSPCGISAGLGAAADPLCATYGWVPRLASHGLGLAEAVGAAVRSIVTVGDTTLVGL